MIQQTIFPFKIETTKERLTAHGGVALMAEFPYLSFLGNPVMAPFYWYYVPSLPP